ncbi:MAG: sulfite exporter TauE/SafE family protein [Hyphomicrobiales bacterium]|nr:sulfite exporter TauE/SafE family protein [Hyphomicrobiales bacterium]
MAYGAVSAAILLSLGITPANTSAAVHTAQIFTCGAAGLSHLYNRNVLWPLVWRLAIPGVTGAVIGAMVLVNVDQEAIRPWISAYLAALGLLILYRVIRRPQMKKPKPTDRAALPTGFIGGMADSVGGGGWGPIATSTLVGRGHEPRFTIGSVSLAEFIVKTASAAAFFVALGTTHMDIVVPLVIGGLIAAPIGGYLVRIVPAKALMLMIGCVVLALSSWQITRLFI